MLTENDFLREILAQPDEDGPRLVFSDWLEERGDLLRAEFIRAQCALAKLAGTDARYKEAQKRELAVRLKYEPIWHKSLPEWTSSLRLRTHRGFGGRVFTTIPFFLKYAKRLFEQFPVQHADYSMGEPYMPRLLACRFLSRLRTLQIDYCQFTEHTYEQMANCPGLERLEGLALNREANLDLRAAEIIVRSPHLKNLRYVYSPNSAAEVRTFLQQHYQGGRPKI